ncbi:hypothetical protein CEE37_12925 [candidate division LCP-89 bacterium B3_LCP]|uniref:Uncharacterized protein n=1 Tax=candidate division LCP-89 bacterium B3_LCP TaxID=2012998 RepID=A0A532UTZ0_UNCL8|nr:MAG: hypothetical protein CEE37_12925 [candidate division LCP-89 bacterium B3_LCP]
MNSLSEEQIRVIARIAMEELGSEATLEKMREIVAKAADVLERQGPVSYKSEPVGRFLVICISDDGLKNSRTLSEALKETNCRITERFERNLAGFHTLLAVIDTQSCSLDFASLKGKLAQAGNDAKIRIIIQPEDTLLLGSKDD